MDIHVNPCEIRKHLQQLRIMSIISSGTMTLADIPPADASWTEILDFALTFDGYEYWGSFERCAEVANAKAHGSLNGLRTCLFFEQRSWRAGDESPPAKRTLVYWRSLLKKMRSLISERGVSEPAIG